MRAPLALLHVAMVVSLALTSGTAAMAQVSDDAETVTPTPGIAATATPVPEIAETAEPDPTPTVLETPTPVVTPTPTATAEPTPTATATAEPTPTATPTASPTPTATPAPAVVPAVPPSVATSTTSWLTVLIAVGVLAAALIIFIVLVRRTPRLAPTAFVAMDSETKDESATVVVDAMAAMGQAMVDSGYSVGMVRTAIVEIAAVNGHPEAEVIVLPTALMLTLDDDGRAITRVVSAGDSTFLLHQVAAVDALVQRARVQQGAASQLADDVARIRLMSPPFTHLQRVVAYSALSAGISVLLGASWLGVLLAVLLGVAVGLLLLFAEQVPNSYRVLVNVAAAFAVGVVVLLVARTSADIGVVATAIAPLVILLPGGLLTTAVIELATGHIMSGAARAAAGAMRLLLLAVGMVAAAALIGVPSFTLDGDASGMNSLAPWIAVAVFGIGISVYQCADRSSILWILLVLYVAYGAQVLGDIFFGGVLSALIGAVAMVPVAVAVARQRTGPPAIVSFLPAFWLLVPGALGLAGVAAVLGGDSSGVDTIVTTVATMISIALGVLIGLALTNIPRHMRSDREGHELTDSRAPNDVIAPAGERHATDEL
ncbi:threonine/serine exporter family protein [Microbacterium sp. NPDC076911]|uniref:threonine/serine ThrE exporter family protein n=1 Tax=Microbacterium sp. NPDC076911 TaxID=3154958 RepID=UPI003431646D